MRKNINNNRAVVDLSEVFSEDSPNDDIRRVLKKLSMQINMDSFGGLADIIDYEKANPSTLSIIKCLDIVRKYRKEDLKEGHPISNIEHLRANNDIMFTDEGVTVLVGKEAEEKSITILNEDKKEEAKDIVRPKGDVVAKIPARLGFITDSSIKLQVACAVDLVMYYTREDDTGGVSESFTNKQSLKNIILPDLDLLKVRAAYRSMKKSVAVSQQLIFKEVCRDDRYAAHYIDMVYSVASKYSKTSELNAKLANIVVDVENKRIKDPKRRRPHVEGRRPMSFQSDFSKIPLKVVQSCNYFWMMQCMSNIRGNDKSGFGNTTVGYYNFSMPPSYVRAINRAREILGMMELLSVTAVRLPDSKEFSVLLISLLIYNGVSVISQAGNMGVHADGSPAGHYGATKTLCLDIKRNKFEPPQMQKKHGIFMEAKNFSSVFESIFYDGTLKSGYIASIVFMTEQVIAEVEKRQYGYFPTLSAHNGKIWVVNCKFVGVSDFTVEEHIGRMYKSVLSRNFFPLTRRPFFYDDVMNKYFAKKLFIPKLAADKEEVPDMGLDAITLTRLRDECELTPEDVKRIEQKEIRQEKSLVLYQNMLMKYKNHFSLEADFSKIYLEDKDHVEAFALLREDNSPIVKAYDKWVRRKEGKVKDSSGDEDDEKYDSEENEPVWEDDDIPINTRDDDDGLPDMGFNINELADAMKNEDNM